MKSILMFNATSANKPPGMGVMEILSENDQKKVAFKELQKFPDWRKMLSNEYMLELTIDEEQWPSVEHYCIAQRYRDNADVYTKLQKNGEYEEESVTLIKTKLKLKKYEYDADILHKALKEKFSDRHLDLKTILKGTKDAILTSWKRGLQTTLTEDGKKIALPSLFTDTLTKVREELLRESSNNDKNNEKNSKKKYDNDHSKSSSILIESSQDVKILSKKEIDDYHDFISKYDPSKNKSNNILTIYEKTNILGVRMEQLALGAESYLNDDEANDLKNVKLIAHREFEDKKIPFIICRVLPDGVKEYWRLEDMK